MMWIDFRIVHFYGLHFVYGFLFYFKQNMVKNPKNSKWLSKCKGSLLEDKKKTQLYGDDDEVQNLKTIKGRNDKDDWMERNIKEHEMERNNGANKEGKEKE